MSVLLVVLAGVLFGLWRLRKRSRADVLAGLSDQKPQVVIEPPTRHLGTRKGMRL